jgi:hypothetical protein
MARRQAGLLRFQGRVARVVETSLATSPPGAPGLAAFARPGMESNRIDPIVGERRPALPCLAKPARPLRLCSGQAMGHPTLSSEASSRRPALSPAGRGISRGLNVQPVRAGSPFDSPSLRSGSLRASFRSACKTASLRMTAAKEKSTKPLPKLPPSFPPPPFALSYTHATPRMWYSSCNSVPSGRLY